MKKVLIGVLNNGEGGTEQCLRMIARYYAQIGVKVDVLILNNNMSNAAWDSLVHQETNVTIFKSKRSSELLGFFYFIFFLLKRAKYDKIFSSHVKVSLILGAFLRFKIIRKTRFVVRESYSSFQPVGGLKLKVFKALYHWGYKKTDLVICQTNEMKQQFDENVQRYSNRSVVIKNPIDFKLIKNNKKEVEDLEWLKNNKYIVSAGRLVDLKGYDLLINAFSLIYKKHQNLKLIILGDGEKREELERLINRLGLQEQISLKGFVHNVYPYFFNADLCVVSSRKEGFPNVLLQMMSQNRKVISTKCADGITEIPGVDCCDATIESLVEVISNSINREGYPNFEEYLKKQSIENFIEKVEKELNGFTK